MNATTIAPLLRQARKTRKLSQADLASRAKLSRKSLGEFERGYQTELGLGRFLNLCEELGLELQLLPRDQALAEGLETWTATAAAPITGKFELRKRLRDLDLATGGQGQK